MSEEYWFERVARNIGDAFAAMCLVFFFFAAALIFTLRCHALYVKDMELLEIPQKTGYSEEKILENYEELVRYCTLDRDITLVLPSMPLSDDAQTHMKEVNHICVFIVRMGKVATVFLLILLPFRWKQRRYGHFKFAGIFLLAFVSVVLLAAATDWDGFFTLFHKVLFRNDLWIFDPQVDPVIRILPDIYFFHCALLFLALLAAAGGVCAFIGCRPKSRMRKREAARARTAARRGRQRQRGAR